MAKEIHGLQRAGILYWLCVQIFALKRHLLGYTKYPSRHLMRSTQHPLQALLVIGSRCGASLKRLPAPHGGGFAELDVATAKLALGTRWCSDKSEFTCILIRFLVMDLLLKPEGTIGTRILSMTKMMMDNWLKFLRPSTICSLPSRCEWLWMSSASRYPNGR
eukprot:s125_g25.t1